MSMPCWFYEKKELRNSPSFQDNIDYETECRYRQDGARFIISAGNNMNLGYNTLATGVVFFHRFYMFHSFREFPRYVTACCCLFLAGKVEETPKKCRDIIRIARSLLTDAKFAQFREDPREEVLTLERILLQTIKFDLHVEHPYQYLLKYGKCLKGDKAKLQKMVQMAWNFVNDSLCTTLCLQWEPEVMAVALLYLAGKLSKFEVVDWVGRTPKHVFWWDMFLEDVTMNVLEDICHQVLDNFSTPQPNNASDSPPLPRRINRNDGVQPPIVPPPNISQVFQLPTLNKSKAQKVVAIEKAAAPVDVMSSAPTIPQVHYDTSVTSVPVPISPSNIHHQLQHQQHVPFLPAALPPPPFPPYPPGFVNSLGNPNELISEKDSIGMIPLVPHTHTHSYNAPLMPLPPSAIPHAAYITTNVPPPPYPPFPPYPPNNAFPPPPNY